MPGGAPRPRLELRFPGGRAVVWPQDTPAGRDRRVRVLLGHPQVAVGDSRRVPNGPGRPGGSEAAVPLARSPAVRPQRQRPQVRRGGLVDMDQGQRVRAALHCYSHKLL